MLIYVKLWLCSLNLADLYKVILEAFVLFWNYNGVYKVQRNIQVVMLSVFNKGEKFRNPGEFLCQKRYEIWVKSRNLDSRSKGT